MERKVITICLLVQVIYVSFLPKCTIYFRGGNFVSKNAVLETKCQNVGGCVLFCCQNVKAETYV